MNNRTDFTSNSLGGWVYWNGVDPLLRDDLGFRLLCDDANQGGTRLFEGATALVSTSNPNPDKAVGGTIGLSYPAIPASGRAHSEAWAFGLRQDEATRSNLAIAHARFGDPTAVSYVVEIYDAEIGARSPAKTLGP